MRMRSIFFIFASALLLLAFQNCTNRGLSVRATSIFKPSEGTSSGNPSGPEVNFKIVSERVFQPHCVECHQVGKSEILYDSYQGAIKHGKLSELVDHYSNGSNPSDECATISVGEMQLITDWLQIGAPE